MDPVVVIILTLIAVSGGGAGGAAVLFRRRKRRQALADALFAKVVHDGKQLSIFDVFWDLGVSDYALALMDNQHLLLDGADALESAHSHLDDLIDAHGTYADFLHDNLAAIQEFYREHRRVGDRRSLATLRLETRKLLPGADQDGSPTRRDNAVSDNAVSDNAGRDNAVEAVDRAPSAALQRDLGRVVRDSIDDRRVFREHGAPLVMTVTPDQHMPVDRGVDVDELVRLEPLQMLKNIFEGRLSDQVKSWWESRRLRAEKSRLDDQFCRLYDLYAQMAADESDFYATPYDIARRWRQEAQRIAELGDRRPWDNQTYAGAADVMVARAEAIAGQLADKAQANVDATIERIHRFARADDFAMAGYLLYLNHHAFFAGRARVRPVVERIERQAGRVRQQLNRLKHNRPGAV